MPTSSVHDGEQKQSLILSCSLRKVATFTAGNGVRSIHIDADGAPGSVANFVRGSIGQSVKRSQVGDNAIVGAGQIRKLFAFIKGAAAGISQFLHLIMRQIERLLLNVELAQRFV